MANISTMHLVNEGAISGESTLPSRVYNKVYQRAQALREQNMAGAVETERLEYGLGILEVLLAVNFLFQLFNASALNLLAKLTNAVTFPFTAPFLNVFGKEPSYALSKPELSTLAAMIVYPIIIWAIIAVIKFGRKRSTDVFNYNASL